MRHTWPFGEFGRNRFLPISLTRQSPAPISEFPSAKPNSGRRGSVSSMPTAFVVVRPFSVRLCIASAVLLRNSRQLDPKPPHGFGASCNSLSRSVGNPGGCIPHGGCNTVCVVKSACTVTARNTDKEKRPLRQKILCHRGRFHYHKALGVLRHSTIPDAALPRLSGNAGKKHFALRALP